MLLRLFSSQNCTQKWKEWCTPGEGGGKKEKGLFVSAQPLVSKTTHSSLSQHPHLNTDRYKKKTELQKSYCSCKSLRRWDSFFSILAKPILCLFYKWRLYQLSSNWLIFSLIHPSPKRLPALLVFKGWQHTPQVATPPLGCGLMSNHPAASLLSAAFSVEQADLRAEGSVLHGAAMYLRGRSHAEQGKVKAPGAGTFSDKHQS